MRFWKLLSSTILILIVCSTPTRAFADEIVDGNGACCKPSYLQTCLDWCRGVTVYGDFLYWKAVEDQLTYSAELPGGLAPFTTIPRATVLSARLKANEQSFKFRPGFRLGIGYDLNCSCWDFQLYWTHLDERFSSRTTNPQTIFPIAIPTATIFAAQSLQLGNEAKSRWRFEFDTIDFEIGRKYCCDCFAFRPFVGVKAAFINQTQHVSYLGFSTTVPPPLVSPPLPPQTIPIGLRSKRTNDFHGVGPSVGVDASWTFCDNFSLSGGISGALLCGKFRVRERPSVTISPTVTSVRLEASKKHRIRPMVDAKIGIDWNYCWCGFPILLGVHYEVEYWWNQWQLTPSAVTSLVSGNGSAQGDLMLHGVTVKMAVGF